MSIISIYDLQDKNLKIGKSKFVVQAINELRKEKRIVQEDYEDVIDVGEFFMKIFEIAKRKKSDIKIVETT